MAELALVAPELGPRPGMADFRPGDLGAAGLRESLATASARWVILIALGLALTGVLIQLAVASPLLADPFERARRQVVYVAVAALLAGAAAAIGYRRAVLWSRPILWITWALLALLLLPGMPSRGGATRWIALGGFHVQPSEMAKLTMILFLTAFAVRRGPFLRTFRGGFLPGFCYTGITAFLVVLEPDLGQTLFLLALSAAVLMVNGLRVKHFLPVLSLLLPAILLVARDQWAYVRERWDGFLAGGAYQVRQALLFFGAGGLDGRGLGEGRGHLFVPEIHNDFALVAVGEQLGLLGTVAVVLAFVFLLAHGVRIALLARSREGLSVAFGITFMITLQAAVNIAVASGSVPPKGISIPFLSFGGSSLLVLGASLGLLVSVARDGATASSSPPPPPEEDVEAAS